MPHSSCAIPVPAPQSRSTPAIADLLTLADQCVKCGYCLPVCPTFQLARNEAESPRGRIALIQGWLSAELAPSPTLFRHLDQCLECRACETVCPSLVRYGLLMDGARAIRRERQPGWKAAPRRIGLSVISQPRWLRLLATVAPLSHALGRVSSVLHRAESRWPKITILKRLGSALHPPREPQPVEHRARSQQQASGDKPEFALFLGCVARGTQGPTIDAARRLLGALGIAFSEPPNQGCCGALHRHQGFPAKADSLLNQNTDAFSGQTAIGFSSACVLELQQKHGIQATDICAFLNQSGILDTAKPRPLAARVLVHEPCSQRLLPGGASAVYAILKRIPRLQVLPLPGNDQCCGAAGAYLIEHPDTALALLEPKIAAVRKAGADVLVTTNSGCALHLATGLRAAGLELPVLHPIELLERQLSTLDSQQDLISRKANKTP